MCKCVRKCMHLCMDVCECVHAFMCVCVYEGGGGVGVIRMWETSQSINYGIRSDMYACMCLGGCVVCVLFFVWDCVHGCVLLY